MNGRYVFSDRKRKKIRKAKRAEEQRWQSLNGPVVYKRVEGSEKSG